LQAVISVLKKKKEGGARVTLGKKKEENPHLIPSRLAITRECEDNWGPGRTPAERRRPRDYRSGRGASRGV